MRLRTMLGLIAEDLGIVDPTDTMDSAVLTRGIRQRITDLQADRRKLLEALNANARLWAAAPDHARIASLFAADKMRWESRTRELCFAGLRHATELDEFGVPKLTDHLRALISRAEGRS